MNISFAKETEKKHLYGLHERALLVDLNQVLKAKLDTGAKTSSLHAQNIKRFVRDGRQWVRFRLGSPSNKNKKPLVERPLLRETHIKIRAEDYDSAEDKRSSARPVIELPVCLGNRMQLIEVNLTDRSGFRYPLLIGSDALKQFYALIDPSLRYIAGNPSCPVPDPAE